MNLIDALDLAPASSAVEGVLRETNSPAHERHARGALIFRPGRFVTPFLIVDGAIRLDHPTADDSTVLLALPGDLLGGAAEQVGQRVVYLEPAVVGGVALHDLLVEQVGDRRQRDGRAGVAVADLFDRIGGQDAGGVDRLRILL